MGGLGGDPTSGVLAGTVSLRLIDLGLLVNGAPTGPSLYWNGTAFTANATNYVQLTAGMQPADPPGVNAPTPWAYTGMNSNNFTDGHQYQVQVQVADAEANPSIWTPV